MQSWIFKPKYGKDIYTKVIEGFANNFLEWNHNGIDFSTEVHENGYVELVARVEDCGSHEYFAETCHTDSPLEGSMLTDHMMVILVDAGVAYQYADGADDHKDYVLEDVDVTQVLGALSEDGTNVYSPYGSRCWIYPVGNDGRKPRTVNILDALLSLQDA